MARIMRNIHVPAYAAGELGVHVLEKRGVAWESLKITGMLIEPELEDICIPSIEPMIIEWSTSEYQYGELTFTR